MQDRFVIFGSTYMVFGDDLFNGIIQIYPRMTPIAMATKFGAKLALTRLI